MHRRCRGLYSRTNTGIFLARSKLRSALSWYHLPRRRVLSLTFPLPKLWSMSNHPLTAPGTVARSPCWSTSSFLLDALEPSSSNVSFAGLLPLRRKKETSFYRMWGARWVDTMSNTNWAVHKNKVEVWTVGTHANFELLKSISSSAYVKRFASPLHECHTTGPDTILSRRYYVLGLSSTSLSCLLLIPVLSALRY